MKALQNIYTKRNVIAGFGYPDGGGHENPDIFDGSNWQSQKKHWEALAIEAQYEPISQ